MATGDPMILGKDNKAQSVTTMLRQGGEQRPGNTLWVQSAQIRDSNGIRIDSLAGGDGVQAIGWGSSVGVNATTDSGIAVIGDASFGENLTLGIGVAAFAKSGVGVWAECANKTTGFAGIFNGTLRVNGDFEIFGTKAAVVKHPDGSLRRLYCVESPESWFEDFGEARLVGGKAEVSIERNFGRLVRGPFQVFLTPYGESGGLYVSRRTSKSFVVREQAGGTSSLIFGYRIVARRRDVEAPRLARVKKTPALKRPRRPRVGKRPTSRR